MKKINVFKIVFQSLAFSLCFVPGAVELSEYVKEYYFSYYSTSYYNYKYSFVTSYDISLISAMDHSERSMVFIILFMLLLVFSIVRCFLKSTSEIATNSVITILLPILELAALGIAIPFVTDSIYSSYGRTAADLGVLYFVIIGLVVAFLIVSIVDVATKNKSPRTSGGITLPVMANNVYVDNEDVLM